MTRKKQKLRQRKAYFMKFRLLRDTIPRSVVDEVREILELLEDEWRDDLCEAIAKYLRTGQRKAYDDSRLMQAMQNKLIRIIEEAL